MSDWFPLPPVPLVVDSAEPYLVLESHLDEFRRYILSVRAKPVDVDISNARHARDVILAIKDVLPFPDWCGSSWDSVEDAYEELRQAWQFPLVIVFHGLASLLKAMPHLGLEVVLRLNGLSEAFSISGDQLVPVYAGENWEFLTEDA